MAITVTCREASTEPRRFAKAELERYLKQMGVAEASIDLAVDPKSGLSDEGYEWKASNGGIRLIAGGELGLVFGAYALLRDLGGCRFSGLGPDGEYIPQSKALEPVKATVRREPQLWYRSIQFSSLNPTSLYHQQMDWMAKNGLNYVTVLLAPDEALALVEIDPATGEPVGGGDGNKYRITEGWLNEHLMPEIRKRGLKVEVNHHNLRLWLPPKKYLEKHPEWYALWEGKRGKNLAQLCICTSNEDAVQTVVDNVLNFARTHRDIKLIGVIPEDGHGMCQCEKCLAQDVDPTDATRHHNYRDAKDENRSLANRYAMLLNRVAAAVKKEFPDVLIGGAAYVDLEWPPRNVELEDNITVWFAAYWRDGSRPLREKNTARINAMFFDLLKQWKAKLTAPLTKYAYYMGMNAQRGLPYPMSHVICEDWEHLKRIGVSGATIQCLVTCHDAYGLNLAAFAESGWNPRKVDPRKLMVDYLQGMFGAAAPAIMPIYEGLQKATEAIAAMPPGEPPQGVEKGILQPKGENAAYFLSYVGDVDAALSKARILAKTDREKRQVERFTQYVGYWKLAANAEDEDTMRGVIAYLAKMPENGWFARSATSKWEAAIKRFKEASPV